MKKLSSIALFLFLLIAVLSPASAEILYENDVNASIEGAYSNLGGQIVADDFVLSADASITGVYWWGYYDEVINPSFYVGFYNDSENLPGTLFYGETNTPVMTDSGLTAYNGSPVYKFEYDFTVPFEINAGDTIWLEIRAQYTEESGDQFLWSRSSYDGIYALRNTHPSSPSTGWETGRPGNFAFGLVGGTTSSVPEPATILLLGSGMVGLITMRRKKSCK